MRVAHSNRHRPTHPERACECRAHRDARLVSGRVSAGLAGGEVSAGAARREMARHEHRDRAQPGRPQGQEEHLGGILPGVAEGPLR